MLRTYCITPSPKCFFNPVQCEACVPMAHLQVGTDLLFQGPHPLTGDERRVAAYKKIEDANRLNNVTLAALKPHIMRFGWVLPGVRSPLPRLTGGLVSGRGALGWACGCVGGTLLQPTDHTPHARPHMAVCRTRIIHPTTCTAHLAPPTSHLTTRASHLTHHASRLTPHTPCSTWYTSPRTWPTRAEGRLVLELEKTKEEGHPPDLPSASANSDMIRRAGSY